MNEIVSTLLLLVGAAFLLLAALGIVRMPDLFTRMSAATKGTTLGVGCMLLAVGVYFPGIGITTRSLAAIAFFFVTAPVAAHMIGRAAYFVGVPLWEGTARDELRGRYDPQTHELERGAPEEPTVRARRWPGPPSVVRVLRRSLRSRPNDEPDE
ncbi:MAG: monovalent cation/H(+) antiporter subunit G [Dehalococcoidia bacterium]